jgi:hypothetical protein
MRRTTLLAILLVAATSNAQLFTEGFVDITNLTQWDFINVSSFPPPSGETGWFQGDPDSFPAFEGASNSYLTVDIFSSQCCLISNWAILPTLVLKDGDRVSFYTRTEARSQRPDRLEVRLSVEGIGSALPSTEAELGSFETLLLSINPDLNIGGYPETWELQTIEIADLGVPTDVRIAFRYYVAAGGVNGINGNYVGIDSVVVDELLGTEDPDTVDFKYLVRTDGQLYLETFGILEKVALYNVFGQQLLTVAPNESTVTLDISHMLSGVYLINVEIDGQIATKKFVKL